MTSRNWIWGTLLAVVLLLAGMSIGVIVDRLFLLRPPPPVRAQLRPVGGEPGPGLMTLRYSGDALQARLGLEAEQRQKIDAILQEWEGRTRLLQDDLRDRFVRSQDDLRREIESVLTPDQVEKFRSLPWVERRPGPRGRMMGPGRRGRE